MSYIGTQPTPQSLESRQEFTATASQTTFATSGYTVGYVDVYLNGVKLSTSDFTATNGSDIVLGSGAAAGDVLAVVMKNDHSELIALPITDSGGNNVLSESGGVVTLTADAAVIEGSSSGDLVRITQTGTGNALVVEDSANPDSTPFVVDSSGRVGIGTTPDTKLNVVQSSTGRSWSPLGGQSDLLVERNGNSGVSIVAATSSTSVLNFGDTDDENAGFIAYYHFDDAMAFRTGGSGEDMRIGSSGAITMPAVYSDTVTGRDLYISSSGQLGYVSSVRSSKTNIENLPSISWLYELTPVKFQYRTKNEDGNYTDEADSEIQYGFIAEDVVEVNSDLVFGDETENGFELRGIQYSRFIAPMIKAIQEQQTLIESQQSQIDVLTARIEALEATP